MLEILEDLTIMFFNLLIFANLITLRHNRPHGLAMICGGCALIFCVYAVGVYLLHFPMVLSSLLCASIPSLVLFWLLSEYRDGRFYLAFALADTLSMITASVSKYLRLFFPEGQAYYLGLTLLLYIGVMVFGKKYFRLLKQLMESVTEGWTDMAVSAMLIYFTLGFVAAYPEPIAQRPQYVWVYLAVCLLAVSYYVVFIHSLKKTQKIEDQNQRLHREQEIYHIAYTDALTGLHNRAAYMERLNQLERNRKELTSVWCMTTDMNYLKLINDTQGHAAGDAALCGLAAALTEAFSQPQETTVFRTGGDEFCVLMTDLTSEEADKRMSEFQRQLAVQSQLTGFSLSAAAGCAWVSAEETVESAMARADEVMYECKKSSRQGAEEKQDRNS